MGIERRKVIIDRSMWLHGHGCETAETALLNNFGQKCCLGFAAEQLCGATEAEILDETTPQGVPSVFLRGLPELIHLRRREGETEARYRDTLFCVGLVEINDSDDYADIDSPQREADLREKFATIGVDVEFVGEYGTATRSSSQQKEAEDHGTNSDTEG